VSSRHISIFSLSHFIFVSIIFYFCILYLSLVGDLSIALAFFFHDRARATSRSRSSGTQ